VNATQTAPIRQGQGQDDPPAEEGR